MDISKYRIYVKEFSLTDDELIQVIKDVLSDIAISTHFFKKAFGFSVEKNIREYDFYSLFKLSESFSYDIDTIYFGGDNSIINKLISLNGNNTNNSQLFTGSFNKNIEYENELIDINDIIKINNNSTNKENKIIDDSKLHYCIVSVFDRFEHINDYKYLYKPEIKENDYFICIVSIIPDIKLIDLFEKDIRNCLISGIKYMLSTNFLNMDDINTTNMLSNIYENEKRKLMNRVNFYQTKMIRRSWL